MLISVSKTPNHKPDLWPEMRFNGVFSGDDGTSSNSADERRYPISSWRRHQREIPGAFGGGHSLEGIPFGET